MADDAERRAANPVLDEATLTAALGQETARVLRSAHDAATELVSKAEAEAARLRTLAQEETAQLHARTEQNASDRIAQAESVASDLRRRTQEEVSSKLEGSKLEAEELVAQARAECRAMVQEAQEVRARVSDRPHQAPSGPPQPDRTAPGGARTPGRDDQRCPSHRRPHHRRVVPGRGRGPTRRRGGRPAGRRPGSPRRTDESDSHRGRRPPASPRGDRDRHLDEDESSRKQAVEELFARLRAERQGAAPESADGGDPSRRRRRAPPAPAATPCLPPRPSRPLLPAPRRARVPESSATPRRPQAPPWPMTTPPRTAPRLPTPVWVNATNSSVPVVTTLVRRIKRALQDDQNDILDRVRAGGGWGPDTLPSSDRPRAPLRRCRPRAPAGRSPFGGHLRGGQTRRRPPVDAVAAELAAAIVVPLRRRLSGAGDAVDVGDDSALIEYVGAAFRDWKGARVERLAGDQALAAFSQASLAGAPKATLLRWIVDDGGNQCPDCDDNALAGAQRPGETFRPDITVRRLTPGADVSSLREA